MLSIYNFVKNNKDKAMLHKVRYVLQVVGEKTASLLNGLG
jgi:hypothetical protein